MHRAWFALLSVGCGPVAGGPAWSVDPLGRPPSIGPSRMVDGEVYVGLWHAADGGWEEATLPDAQGDAHVALPLMPGAGRRFAHEPGVGIWEVQDGVLTELVQPDATPGVLALYEDPEAGWFGVDEFQGALLHLGPGGWTDLGGPFHAQRSDGAVLLASPFGGDVVRLRADGTPDVVFGCEVPALNYCDAGVDGLSVGPGETTYFSSTSGEQHRVWSVDDEGIRPAADRDYAWGIMPMYWGVVGEHVIATQRTENTGSGWVNLITRRAGPEDPFEWELITELPRVISLQTAGPDGAILFDGAPEGGFLTVRP